MAKRKAAYHEEGQHAPEPKSVKKMRRDGPSPEKKAGGRGPGDELTAKDGSGRESSARHQSEQGVGRRETWDKDEHRRNRRAEQAPEPTSVAAADEGGDGPPESGAGRTRVQEAKPTAPPEWLQRRLAAGGDGDVEEASATHARQGTDEGKKGGRTRKEDSKRRRSSTPDRVREPAPGAGAHGQGKLHETPALGRQLSPLVLPQAPATVSPPRPGPAATPAKSSPPAGEASIPANATAPPRPGSPSPAPDSKSPRSRHPPLPCPAARPPIPASGDDDNNPFDPGEVFEAAAALWSLLGVMSYDRVLMTALNAAHDGLPLLLTKEGMKAAPARAERFCHAVLDMHKEHFGPISLSDLMVALKVMSERLNGLWAAGRRAVRIPEWEEDPVTRERYAVV